MKQLLGIAGTFLTAFVLPVCASAGTPAKTDLHLIPYPQEVKQLSGTLKMGPASYETSGKPSETAQIAIKSLNSHLPKTGKKVRVRIGSVEEGFADSWLTSEEKAFLKSKKTSPEASVLKISADGITVVGKGKWGMLYGVQTVNQLAIKAAEKKQSFLQCVDIRDWPDMSWRCLSPSMTWYSGYNRLEGYDLNNWTLDEWKWLVDWSLLHKCNGWAMCIYGNWPFTLPGYSETTLDVDSFFYDPKTGQKTPWRFVHKNIKKEFLPELIRYANERGVQIYAYIGKNTFNGTYGLKHPEADAGGAAELIPFAPGVHQYWDAFIKRFLELGFNGFVFEDPEAMHVPNQNQQCYDTFWKPWAKEYGFKSIAETNQYAPPLGVHVEYYTWLFREFDSMIQKHAKELGRPTPDIYLISHILLQRMVNESRTKAERDKWFAYIDEKQGRKVPYIIAEAEEKKYVDFLGHDRVASLGGRGGSCTCAMRRIASVNNNWCGGGMGGCLDYERQCQKHIYEAGGFGAMGYIFEWTNTEVFGYIASQYLWHNSGVPGINNDDQTSFLNYAYKAYYGDKVGELVAKAMDEGPDINDAMVFEGIYGSQWPGTGSALHRDYQLLAKLADHGLELATKAYKLYTGKEPDLYHPVYKEEDYRWNGYDPKSDKLFKAERLRLACVSMKRSQEMCECALAHRKSQMLIASGATAKEVLEQLDRSVKAAEANQRLYSLNYDDDYDWTDGLCSRVTEHIKMVRDQFIAGFGPGNKTLEDWTFNQAGNTLGWTETNDLTIPSVENGALVTQATGSGPFIVQTEALMIPVDNRSYVEIEMSSDQKGFIRTFWRTDKDPKPDDPKACPFSEARVINTDVTAGDMTLYKIMPRWDGTLTDFRIDTPKNAKVQIKSIRIIRVPTAEETLSTLDLSKHVPEAQQKTADRPMFIPWEKITEILPAVKSEKKPGLYISTDVGLDQRDDLYKLGVVFTIQVENDGKWQTVFSRAVDRRSAGWEHWDIPVPAKSAKIRFMTDSYSRTQDRGSTTWNWALWGKPQLVEIGADGKKHVKYDFAGQIDKAQSIVRLDSDGKERPFNAKYADSTGATFKLAEAGPIEKLKAGEGKNWQWVDGFADWAAGPSQRGVYPCFLGSVDSGWAYAAKGQELYWNTAAVPEKKETMVALIAGTGYAPGKADLWCDGKKLVTFEMAMKSDAKWEENGAELRYIFGGDTQGDIPYGISGIYLLKLPASMVTPGKPLDLAVKMQAETAGDWFMVHGYRDILNSTRGALPPKPAMPTIAAFAPHVGCAGVTIAEYDIDTQIDK